MLERIRLFRRLGAAGLALTLALLLGAGALARPGQPVFAAGHSVSIVDFAFNSASLTVAVGDTVTWTNTGKTAHTSTADNGAWDSGTLQPGASFSHTFTTAGTFSYHCNIHPFMMAMITVTGATAAPAAPAAQPVAAAPAGAAQPASQAAPVSAPQAAAPAGGSVAVAPQLPSTGTGGLLDRSTPGGLDTTSWLLIVLVTAVIAGAGRVCLARRLARKQPR